MVTYEGVPSCAEELDVAHSLSDQEWQHVSSMPSESVGELLADAFTVRIAHQDEATTHVAEPLPQGEAMPLRALTLLAAFPLALVASTGDHGRGGDRIRPSGDYLGGSIQRQGERQEEAQGAVGGQVRCIPDDGSGSARSQANANQAAYWTTCTCCGMRLSYTPVFGGHGIYRKAGPIPEDTKVQVEALGEQAPYSDYLKDRTIAMDAAERSCLKRLEKIRADKEKLAPRGARPKAGTTPFPQHPGEPSTAPPPKSLTPSGPVVDLEAGQHMPPHPSRERTQSGGATGEHRPDQEFSSTVGDLGCFMGQCVSSWRDRFGKLKGPLDGGNEEVGDNLQVDDAGMTILAEGHLTFEEKKLMLSYIQEGHPGD